MNIKNIFRRLLRVKLRTSDKYTTFHIFLKANLFLSL